MVENTTSPLYPSYKDGSNPDLAKFSKKDLISHILGEDSEEEAEEEEDIKDEEEVTSKKEKESSQEKSETEVLDEDDDEDYDQLD